MDRHAQRGLSSPTIRRATIRPMPRWRWMRDGRFLALRVASVANIGAYMAGGAGAVQTNQYVHLQGSIYDDSRHRAARRDGAEQHHADRRHARARALPRR